MVGLLAACSKKESAPEPAHDQVSPHGKEIDNAHASQLAMFKAAEGATPCETALNAFIAEGDAARKLGRPSVFSFVAERDAFLTACNALGAAVQACLAPHYAARHRQECETAMPPNEKLANLFVLRDDSEAKAKEPPLPTPKP